MLRLQSVTAGYQRTPVLKDVSLSIEEGSITALIGPNGSGKSTLLKAAVGLCEVYDGTIYYNEVNKEGIGRQKFARSVFYLPQIHTGGAICVSRMVLHGRFPHLSYPRHYGKKDYDACSRAMERVGITELKDKRVNELSGGQRQKVYLAMALAGEPEIFLFDEPAAYLDIQYQLELLRLMKQLKDQGKTVVVILHDLNYVMQVADRIAVLEQGQMVFAGTREELLKSDVISRVFHVKPRFLKDEEGIQHLFFVT